IRPLPVPHHLLPGIPGVFFKLFLKSLAHIRALILMNFFRLMKAKTRPLEEISVGLVAPVENTVFLSHPSFQKLHRPESPPIAAVLRGLLLQDLSYLVLLLYRQLVMVSRLPFFLQTLHATVVVASDPLPNRPKTHTYNGRHFFTSVSLSQQLEGQITDFLPPLLGLVISFLDRSLLSCPQCSYTHNNVECRCHNYYA